MAFESLTERLNGVFKKLRGKGKLNEADIKAAMREVRMALLEADVNYKVAKDFCAQVSERAMGQEVMESLTPAQQVVKIVNEELTKLMGGDEPQYLRIKNKGQTVLMMCGLQGNGKTTHAAKLGRYYRSQGRRPLLVACDVYRPAALPNIMTRIFPLPRLPRISALPARVCGTPSSMAKPPWMSWKRSWVTPAATHRCRKTSPGCTNWSWRSGAAIRGCSTRYRASARIPTKC